MPMLLAQDGRRLSKRDHDIDFGYLRSRFQPEEIVGLLGWLSGLLPKWEKISALELAAAFSWENVRREDIRVDPKQLRRP